MLWGAVDHHECYRATRRCRVAQWGGSWTPGEAALGRGPIRLVKVTLELSLNVTHWFRNSHGKGSSENSEQKETAVPGSKASSKTGLLKQGGTGARRGHGVHTTESKWCSEPVLFLSTCTGVKAEGPRTTRAVDGSWVRACEGQRGEQGWGRSWPERGGRGGGGVPSPARGLNGGVRRRRPGELPWALGPLRGAAGEERHCFHLCSPSQHPLEPEGPTWVHFVQPLPLQKKPRPKEDDGLAEVMGQNSLETSCLGSPSALSAQARQPFCAFPSGISLLRWPPQQFTLPGPHLLMTSPLSICGSRSSPTPGSWVPTNSGTALLVLSFVSPWRVTEPLGFHHKLEASN